ncbi:hypothetical protein ACHAXS_000260, partial [Conticribra weissflogii]
DDENGIDNGSAYVFARNEDGWDQVAKLVSNDSELRFGSSVAISGDIALVGACSDNEDVFSICSVWVFVHSEDGWDQVDKLMPSERAGLYLFGWSVAISEDTALVGVPRDTFRGIQYGSARVFNRNEDGWVEVANLRAEDDTSFRFGTSVAISGDISLIGSPEDANGTGSAYVFARNEDGWDKVAKLLADDGAQSDRFGFSVAISGDTVVVGAYGDDKRGRDSGSAYVFVRTHGDGWVQMAKLLANDGKAVDMFGYSVAISGDTALVGAVHGDDENISNIGSAYLFVRNDTGWAQTSKLVPHNGTEYDYFGFSVAIGGDSVVVGAYGDGDNGLASGAGYIYDIISLSTSTINSSFIHNYSSILSNFGFNNATLSANSDSSFQFQFTNSIP